MTGEMRFMRPRTVAQVTAILARDAGYRCLAGGGLIVPALRAEAKPAGLVSLRRVAGLRGITRAKDGAIRIGAMTPHVQVMNSPLLGGGNALVALAAAQIANPVIRNMATAGGTLCRADPSADYSCALLAAGATIQLRSSQDDRSLAIEDFTIGNGQTARRDEELLVAVSLPGDDARGSSGYARFSRVDGDYAVATAAVRLGWSGGQVASARIAVGGCGPTAYLVDAAGSLLTGAGTLDEVPETLVQAAIAAAKPSSDLKGSAEFRLRLIPGLLRRALTQAFTVAR
jgi:carbon-monoxide dehydrogenase medium subunit